MRTDNRLDSCITCSHFFPFPQADNGQCRIYPTNHFPLMAKHEYCGEHSNLQKDRLRDKFAGQALLGMLTHDNTPYSGATIDSMATFAYRHADAMLAERDK